MKKRIPVSNFDLFPVRVLLAESTTATLPGIVDFLKDKMLFAWYDGLNAWFVENESENLVELIRRPASPVMDWYHPFVYWDVIRSQHETIVSLQQSK
ncbi:hypothetical protein N9I65_01470 [bacterium]|nr:hypothetical protein [bacterium]